MTKPRNKASKAHPEPLADSINQPILGWTRPDQGCEFGFIKTAAANDSPQAIVDAGEGHLITIAPTGAGKGRSAIIPTLLSYRGPVIVIDPKGENYEVTARRRKEMGQRVFRLDPFEVTGDKSDSFNVLSCFNTNLPDAYDHASSLAELMLPAMAKIDPFWEDSARLLLTALILHVASARPPVLRNLAEVIYLLNQKPEDLQFTIKEMQLSKHDIVRQLGNSFSHTEAKVWASILSTAKAGTAVFNSSMFHAMSGVTFIPLDDIVAGKPVSIYLILPPDKIDSHGRYLRLWIGCLINQITRRRHKVDLPTLFILDEAAQLGRLNQLRRAITLLRGYGLRTWSFWQDLSQLQSLYPDWKTLFNNCRYIQTFGCTTAMLSASISDLLHLNDNIYPLRLRRNEMILAEAGCNARVVIKPDYLNDPLYQGLYDANPFHQPGTANQPHRQDKPALHSEREAA